MDKLQSGPPGNGQILTMAEMKLRVFFFQQQTSFCVDALELRRLVARDVPTIAYPQQDILLLADSKLHHVGAQYSVLSLVTTSCVKIEYFANTSVKNQRTSELSVAESKCADTDASDSGILQRSLRTVEPVDAFLQATWLSST